ncbi:histone lysine demethylase PHF8-like isoform X2 [Acanthaster planci]|uniref:Histone lysine demethylase PHF8-like isoform X2 n=1 Tax=Acanthaster planci TaxID=133434 RepID=A0A8B7XN79_ACAPL|nr:histone lysine demethylase PHF8-like isoform X2 [Acanthaster planci]
MASTIKAPVYCICRQPYDASQFMIECDTCQDWFHGSCVGIREDQSADIEEYHCPNCELKQGPLILKKRRNWHRHDYTEDSNFSKAVQSGTLVFIKSLKNRTFSEGDDILLRLNGSELTVPYLERNGFTQPILVESKEGLGLQVPPQTFTVSDVERYVGSMRDIDAIDVPRQNECKMPMRQWVDYYNSPNRDKVLNVISLEFSGTKLSNLVQAPKVVREISWVENIWPDQLPEDCHYGKPEVSKYCLMGVKDSYTDFHVDFGGTSVWYHVLRGEKVFFMIRPTPENLQRYEEWNSSPHQSEIFLGDRVDYCYKCVVKQGHTLFIPTGWIHAVLTPVDSLVFGGNFLHSFNIPVQIQIYNLERRLKTPPRFQFPWFETTMWFGAKHLYEVFRDYNEDSKKPPPYLILGAKALSEALKNWTRKREQRKIKIETPNLKQHQQEIPLSIQHSQLLKDLNKEIKLAEKPSMNKLKNKGKHKKNKKGKKSKDVKTSKKNSTGKRAGGPRSTKDKDKKRKVSGTAGSSASAKKEANGKAKKAKKKKKKDGGDAGGSAEGEGWGKSAGGLLEGRSPSKVGHRLPDLITHPLLKKPYHAEASNHKPNLKMVFPRKGPGEMSGTESEDEKSRGVSKGLKLVLSNGKIISRGGSPVKQSNMSDGFQPLFGSTNSGPRHSSSQDTASESEDVIVDDDGDDNDTSMSRDSQRRASQSLVMRSREMLASKAPLKLKLSFNGKPVLPIGSSSSQDSSQESSGLNTSLSGRGTRSDSDSDSEDGDVLPSDRSPRQSSPYNNVDALLQASQWDQSRPLPSISLADIEAELKHQPASPGTQDAIQGMLSIAMPTPSLAPNRQSSLGSSLSSASPHSSPFLLPGQKRKWENSSSAGDTEEDLPNCFQDSKYVYPSLDDDGDGPLFKSRSKNPKKVPKDAPWNPKAKVCSLTPRARVPSRDSARRPHIETGLAEAAARLATKPRPKRQYIRRKPPAPVQPKVPDPYDFDDDGEDEPSTSSSLLSQSLGPLHMSGPDLRLDLTQSAPSSVLSNSPRAMDGVAKGLKRPKKGMATAKQRLSKILKLKKGGRLIM